ncbi:MAG: TlpA family protein disulfide reductase [Actinomycetota bacterium]|nr:TlpA family protein disulfide reductase [Actinomycetota bacterium]
MEETTASPDALEAELDTLERTDPPAVASPKTRDLTKGLLGLVILLLVTVLAVQIIQLRQTSNTSDEVAALAEDVTDLKPLRRDVDILGSQVAALDSRLASGATTGASPTAVVAQGADGSLPPFQDSANDAAVLNAMTIATISGPEYYTGADASFAATDGKARVWMVWAHWCPYCQAELPELKEWYPANAARFPNVELVTISSAIDDTRDNPLVPYLDSEQFPFPVIVDETGEVAQLFGTTAFPFWAVTDAEGTVVLRVAGALDVDNVDQIFAQLEEMATET